MTKYTPEIKSAVGGLMALKPYPTLQVAIAEYPNTLTVRVFEKNIMSFSTTQYENILEYLILLRDTVRSFGVKCEIEGVRNE